MSEKFIIYKFPLTVLLLQCLPFVKRICCTGFCDVLHTFLTLLITFSRNSFRMAHQVVVYEILWHALVFHNIENLECNLTCIDWQLA